LIVVNDAALGIARQCLCAGNPQAKGRAMRNRVSKASCQAAAALLVLVAGPLMAQTAPVRDEVCVSCHAEPSTRFHSQPSHKKLSCANCHVGGAEHVADTRARPKLGGDPKLCASCHEAKKKHGSGG
jgi:hypothetical protein